MNWFEVGLLVVVTLQSIRIHYIKKQTSALAALLERNLGQLLRILANIETTSRAISDHDARLFSAEEKLREWDKSY